jgi:excisionase family DNA binding protein
MVTLDGVPYLTVAEVCALLGVKPATVYAYVSRGVLHSYKQGIRRQRLYRQDEVEALLAVQPGGGLAAPEADAAPDDPLLRLPRADGWIGEL